MPCLAMVSKTVGKTTDSSLLLIVIDLPVIFLAGYITMIS